MRRFGSIFVTKVLYKLLSIWVLYGGKAQVKEMFPFELLKAFFFLIEWGYGSTFPLN
jgi:hypothetical protein